jgi:hypothetical protein
MRFAVRDLLIAATAFLLGIFAIQTTCRTVGFAMRESIGIALGTIAGLAIYLVATPVIYQRFHMRPLWYPLCPICRDRNRFWAFKTAMPNWPRENVRCFTCGTILEIWYNPTPNDSRPLAKAPTFALIWPQSFGRWRRIDSK